MKKTNILISTAVLLGLFSCQTAKKSGDDFYAQDEYWKNQFEQLFGSRTIAQVGGPLQKLIGNLGPKEVANLERAIVKDYGKGFAGATKGEVTLSKELQEQMVAKYGKNSKVVGNLASKSDAVVALVRDAEAAVASVASKSYRYADEIATINTQTVTASSRSETVNVVEEAVKGQEVVNSWKGGDIPDAQLKEFKQERGNLIKNTADSPDGPAIVIKKDCGMTPDAEAFTTIRQIAKDGNEIVSSAEFKNTKRWAAKLRERGVAYQQKVLGRDKAAAEEAYTNLQKACKTAP